MGEKKISRRDFTSFLTNKLVTVFAIGTAGVSLTKNLEQYSRITELESDLLEEKDKLEKTEGSLSATKTELESEKKRLKSRILLYFEEDKDPSRVLLSMEDDRNIISVPLVRNEFPDCVLMSKSSGLPYTLRYEIYNQKKSTIEVGVYLLKRDWSDLKSPSSKIGYLVFGIHSRNGEYIGSDELLKLLV